MPLKSRLTRAAPTPEAAASAAVQENTSPRRRLAPAPPETEMVADPTPAPDAVDQAAEALGNAVADAPDDAGADGYEEAAPAMYGRTPAPTPKQRKQRQARAKVELPEDAAYSDDPGVLAALMRKIEAEVDERRKEYRASVAPLVEQYKLAAARRADLLGR